MGKHSIMSELKKKASADKSDTTAKALETTKICLRLRRSRAPLTRHRRWRRSTDMLLDLQVRPRTWHFARSALLADGRMWVLTRGTPRGTPRADGRMSVLCGLACTADASLAQTRIGARASWGA